MRKLVYIGDSVLREKAKEVSTKEIKGAYIQDIIKSMEEVLDNEKFGVALAAPQIGVPLRFFIVGGHVFASKDHAKYIKEDYPDQIFINPKIVRISKKMKIGDEGCLSIPRKYGTKVLRNDKITISYYDENGMKKERGASSFIARVFQHEIDHLNGILYTDEADEVIDVDDELKPL